MIHNRTSQPTIKNNDQRPSITGEPLFKCQCANMTAASRHAVISIGHS
ncbi:hypothetical protein [Paenibacillus odorifer]|nr:hypothetical protein [Paenibacillus odorifer]